MWDRVRPEVCLSLRMATVQSHTQSPHWRAQATREERRGPQAPGCPPKGRWHLGTCLCHVLSACASRRPWEQEELRAKGCTSLPPSRGWVRGPTEPTGTSQVELPPPTPQPPAPRTFPSKPVRRELSHGGACAVSEMKAQPGSAGRCGHVRGPRRGLLLGESRRPPVCLSPALPAPLG